MQDVALHHWQKYLTLYGYCMYYSTFTYLMPIFEDSSWIGVFMTVLWIHNWEVRLLWNLLSQKLVYCVVRGALKVQKVESKVPNDFHIRRETEKWSPIHRNCCRKISILSSEKWKLSPFFHFTLRSNYPRGREYFTTGMHHFFMIQKVAGSLSCLWMLSGSRTNSALRRVFLQWEEPKFNLLISGQYGLYQLLEAWVSKAVNEGKVTSSSFIEHS